MSQPDRLENPEEPEPPPSEAGSPGARPDWLVGADEGVEAELNRSKRLETEARFELRRPADPGADPVESPPANLPRPKLVRADEGASWNTLPEKLARRNEPVEEAPPPVKWTGAGSSVPRLSHASAPPPPMTRFVEPPRVAEPRPAAARYEDPLGLEEPEEDPLESPFPGPPKADDRSSRPSGASRALPPPPHEPLWMVVLDTITTNRTVQLAAAGVFVLVLAIVFWPRGGGGGVDIAAIRRHPETYEGRVVRVQGRVGEVFEVGQGHVFNLHQGRDTIVVFTRLRTPESRRKTLVIGSVSTGYLDGVARVAVFETSLR